MLLYFLYAGSDRSKKTMESTAVAVCRHFRQSRVLPVLCVFCGILAHRGPPLLQHRKPHRAYKRQKLLGHIQIGQPFCVKVVFSLYWFFFSYLPVFCWSYGTGSDDSEQTFFFGRFSLPSPKQTRTTTTTKKKPIRILSFWWVGKLDNKAFVGRHEEDIMSPITH